jgi:alkylhydroperoxidase family enzyme
MSPRIGWIEEGDARGQLADLFESARAGSISGVRREHVPDIMHVMSHRPDFLAAMMDVSRVHFSDGALTRAQHEMIASYVSALNKCHY